MHLGVLVWCFFRLLLLIPFERKSAWLIQIISLSYSALSTTENIDQTEDFSPGLLFFLSIGIGFILACVGAGIILRVLLLLLIFGLVAFGVLSTSIVIGLYNKSFSKGFKSFVILSSTAFGLLFLSSGFWALNKIMYWWTTGTAILTGATCGLITGLAFGFSAFYVLQLLTKYFKIKLKTFKSAAV